MMETPPFFLMITRVNPMLHNLTIPEVPDQHPFLLLLRRVRSQKTPKVEEQKERKRGVSGPHHCITKTFKNSTFSFCKRRKEFSP